MKNNTQNDDQSGQKPDAEKQAPVSKAAKKQTKQKGVPKQAKKKEVEAEPGKSPEAPETGKAPEAPKPVKKPRKNHKKKGTKNDVPPVSLGMTQPGFAALLACEAANPEMTRKQVIENALKLYAKHVAYLPPIQLTRIDSDSLITMAGIVAKWETSCKATLRKIILAEYDEEEKAKHVDELETELHRLRETRLTLCRMAGIPISHILLIDLQFVIATLLMLQKQESEDSYFAAYEKAILILSAYKPEDPESVEDQENPDTPEAT
ncbi:MAG: hypothetical protein EAZ82_12270 [Verrucomicrobia bacterium]|nr:MAG: hypothetical protein EAZ82_12270 [Verrucomicrobiota bacterium]